MFVNGNSKAFCPMLEILILYQFHINKIELGVLGFDVM